MALSKIRRYEFRRYLQHLQRGCAPIFVSMSTRARWTLPPAARDIVLESILREDRVRIDLLAAIVMPDHVHMLFCPREDLRSGIFSLSEIMNGVRSPSAHRINRLLGRKGPVWNEEFFDHLPRFGELDQELAYICENPVKAGLVQNEEDYAWLWVEPTLVPAEGGRARDTTDGSAIDDGDRGNSK
jgi:REP element-mobilizing transposase RayT